MNNAPVELEHLYSNLYSPITPCSLLFVMIRNSPAGITYHWRVLQLVVSFTLEACLIRPVQPTNLMTAISQLFVNTVSTADVVTVKLSVSKSLYVWL